MGQQTVNSFCRKVRVRPSPYVTFHTCSNAIGVSDQSPTRFYMLYGETLVTVAQGGTLKYVEESWQFASFVLGRRVQQHRSSYSFA